MTVTMRDRLDSRTLEVTDIPDQDSIYLTIHPRSDERPAQPLGIEFSRAAFLAALAGEMQASNDAAAMALGRLVQAIYVDPTSVEWIKGAPVHVVQALSAAQRLVGIGAGQRATANAPAPSPLTAADFETQYDAEKSFPFWHTEDDEIVGYGHPDKTLAADQVKAYYEYTDPGGDQEVYPADVHHRWAVRATDFACNCGDPLCEDEKAPGIIWARPHPDLQRPVPVREDEPGAFPIWTVTP